MACKVRKINRDVYEMDYYTINISIINQYKYKHIFIIRSSNLNYIHKILYTLLRILYSSIDFSMEKYYYPLYSIDMVIIYLFYIIIYYIIIYI